MLFSNSAQWSKRRHQRTIAINWSYEIRFFIPIFNRKRNVDIIGEHLHVKQKKSLIENGQPNFYAMSSRTSLIRSTHDANSYQRLLWRNIIYKTCHKHLSLWNLQFNCAHCARVRIDIHKCTEPAESISKWYSHVIEATRRMVFDLRLVAASEIGAWNIALAGNWPFSTGRYVEWRFVCWFHAPIRRQYTAECELS